mgnify:CR=1 FL=1
MKKTLLVATTALFMASQASAMHYSPYVSAKLKYLFMKNDAKVTWRDPEFNHRAKWHINDEVFGGNVAAGLAMPLDYISMRMEAEYDYNGDAKKKYNGLQSKVKTQAMLFNMYLDYDMTCAFKPYIGAGLGGARLKGSIAGESESKTTLAWQAGAGAAYMFDDHMALDGGYRFMSYGDFSKRYNGADYSEKHKLDSYAHEIYLGLRYMF